MTLDSNTALFYLGDTVDTIYNKPTTQRIPGELAGRINSFVRNGGRLVITFLPRNRMHQTYDEIPEPEDMEKDTSNADNDDETDEKDRPRTQFVTVSNWLGLDFEDSPMSASSQATWTGEPETANLPQTVSCHTSLCFADMDEEAWTTIYERQGRPVLVQKRLGKGTLVLSAVTYFVSNEAMRDERYPALLAWLVGNKKRVIFDEYHHGMIRRRGTATLIRKYRLHWLAAGMVLLAGLFVWQNSVSLVPPFTARDTTTEVALGKDSSSGLVNLLRRNIPSSRIFSVCLNEWKRAESGKSADQRRKTARVNAFVTDMARMPDPKPGSVESYNRIVGILKEINRHQIVAGAVGPGPAPAGPATTRPDNPADKQDNERKRL
jgi:hypothetical protein